MPQVKALVLFEHHGRRNAGDIFDVSEKHATELETKGLVTSDVASCQAKSEATASTPRSRTAKPKKAGVEDSSQTGNASLDSQQSAGDQSQGTRASDAPAPAPAADADALTTKQPEV